MMLFVFIECSLTLHLINGQSATTESVETLYSLVFSPPPDDLPVIGGVEIPISETPPIEDCICVPFNQCYENGTINDSGISIIDPRGPFTTGVIGKCVDALEVCCKAPKDLTDLPQISNPPYRRSSKCGRRNFSGVGFRISARNKANFGEFPWMVGLLKVRYANDEEIPEYHCGGSLIHPKVVLTATHCVNQFKNNDIIVRAGEWDSQSVNEIIPYQERKVSEILTHGGFNSGSLYNDIALLFLEDAFELADNVDVVCLPKQNMIFEGAACVATGWGADKFGTEGVYQNVLKKIDLPILNRNHCLQKLRKTRLTVHFQLHQSFICAGGKKGEDTCKGDGGSPLVCPIEGNRELYQQAGIVSWGIGCGSDDIPAVYVNVALFRNWIDLQLQNHKLDMTEYNEY